MRRLVTGTQMKAIDNYAINTIGIPSVVLMERAAQAVVEAMEAEWYPLAGSLRTGEHGRVLVLCGTGNNGADGAAVARILHLKGFSVTVLTVGEESVRTKETILQLSIDEKLGIPVMEFSDFIPGTYDIVIDALFGVGLSRNLEGEFKDAVEISNKLNQKITVAVDIPSGIHSDTGVVMANAVRADVTVTFGYEKLGTILYPGKEYSGRVIVADIGFPPCETEKGILYYTFDKEDLKRIPVRRQNSHKGMYGKVLIVAGSKGMCGAAYLSALSAYRTGVGLVKIMTVEENVGILQNLIPEAIITSYDPELEEREPEAFKAMVEKECDWAEIIVLGPGLGKGRHVAKLLEYVLLSAYVPIILDADGLNAVSEYPYLADFFTENVIVTPHIGEMSRLTEKDVTEIKNDLIQTAVSYSEQYGVTCVLKDAVSIVAEKDGSVYINTSGDGAMAKAGSGDVLTGIIAGLIALSLEEDNAAALGVYIHGLAGETAAKIKGEHSLLAREIADSIMQEETHGTVIQ